MKDDMGLPILDAFGKEISNITSYYGFLSQREIESLDKHLINQYLLLFLVHAQIFTKLFANFLNKF